MKKLCFLMMLLLTAGIVSAKDDAQLNLGHLKQLLDRVARTIHAQPDRVRYTMNAFVIAVGSYVQPLTADAIATAKTIGKVTVDMGETACQVPDAGKYIDKVKQRGAIGKKRQLTPRNRPRHKTRKEIIKNAVSRKFTPAHGTAITNV